VVSPKRGNPPVVICVCRNLNQARVLKAIEEGAETAEEVHPACGVEVNCGCCLETIEDMIGGVQYALRQAAE
jgi:bacterioferritin-associated ferredoxin